MESIMVFAPHQDDEAFSCGGAIATHVKAGDEVFIVFTTDGREASNPLIEGKYTPDELVLVREGEAIAAAAALGVQKENVHFFRYHDKDLGNPNHKDELIGRLSGAITARGPGIIYLAMTNYNHPDHRATYFSVFETLEKIKFTGDIRVSHVHSVFSMAQKRPGDAALQEAFARVERLFPLVETITIDYSSSFEEKYESIIAHDSQMGMFTKLVDPEDDFKTALREIFDDVYRDRIETYDVRRLAS